MWKIAGIDEFIIRIIKRPDPVGIAFGGGGVRGFCHVGVIKAFEQFGIRPSVISGVSAGSIAAVLYAAGLDSSQIRDCFAGSEKIGRFTDWTIPKKSFLKLDKFAKILDSWLPVKNLEELAIPTIICATDFDNGKSVGWAKGEIVPRVVASCSIPIVFPPVKINGCNYVDGGVLRNLPAWAVRRHCKVLFGSNCSPLNRDFSAKDNILDTAVRSYQLMAKANTLQDINMCDFLIQPTELTSVGTFELSRMDQAVEIGYSVACRVIEDAIECKKLKLWKN